MNSSPENVQTQLANFNFNVSLPQSLLITLEAEVKWARRAYLLPPAGRMPNFLDSFYLEGLLAVKPDGVTVIH